MCAPIRRSGAVPGASVWHVFRGWSNGFVWVPDPYGRPPDPEAGLRLLAAIGVGSTPRAVGRSPPQLPRLSGSAEGKRRACLDRRTPWARLGVGSTRGMGRVNGAQRGCAAVREAGHRPDGPHPAPRRSGLLVPAPHIRSVTAHLERHSQSLPRTLDDASHVRRSRASRADRYGVG